jgi:hypothetical protein
MVPKPKPKPNKSKYRKICNLLKEKPEWSDYYKKFKRARKGFLIPINDLEAYEMYPEHNWIYNRLELSRWQNEEAYPLPIKPRKNLYPIIIKPIINLYGLSLECYKVKSRRDFSKYWQKTHFWTKYYESPFTLSTDLLLDHGQILMSYTFKGHLSNSNGTPGYYDYWELLRDFETPKIIQRLIKEKLKSYRGLLNVETINGHIIEAHLRMGDLDSLLEKEILEKVLTTLISGPNASPTAKRMANPTKIYLIPIFLRRGTKFRIKSEDIRNLARGCLFYEIDSKTQGHPPKYRRVVLLTTDNLSEGFKARRRILATNKKLTNKI